MSSVSLDRVKDGSRLVKWYASNESQDVDLQPGSAGSLSLPATFSGSQLTVKCYNEDGTYELLYKDGQLFTMLVTNGRNVVPPELFTVNGVVRFVSDQTETCDGRYYPVR